MRPFRTLLIGIIAFVLGIVVANMRPLSATESAQAPQQSPVSVKKGPDGVPTFQNLTKNPVLIVGFGDQGQKGSAAGNKQPVTAPDGTSVYLIYEVTRNTFNYRIGPGELGPCAPAICSPPPPPCPGCPPWHVTSAWQINPGNVK